MTAGRFACPLCERAFPTPAARGAAHLQVGRGVLSAADPGMARQGRLDRDRRDQLRRAAEQSAANSNGHRAGKEQE